MRVIKAKYPHIEFDDDRLTPMGIMARVSVFGVVKGKVKVMLCFIPGNLSEGEIHFETGERNKSKYLLGSIGDLNDMGKISVKLEIMQQLYDLIEKQLSAD